MDNQLNQDDIANKYNNIKEVWSLDDKWHYYTHNQINNYIVKCFKTYQNLRQNPLILNAGSGGSDYGLKDCDICHVDIAKEKIKNYPKYILASIEKIPIEDFSIDLCICVGSVLNYCNPELALAEFQRVLKHGGSLILEFEKTNSLELIGSRFFNKTSAIVQTFYNGNPEKLWMYDEYYILELLKRNKFVINDFKRFHIISPLVYKILKNENFSSYFAKFDLIFRYFPILRNYSSNIILTCKKEI